MVIPAKKDISSHSLSYIQVQKSFKNMDVGMHHAKNRGNKEIPLAILSRILHVAQSCVLSRVSLVKWHRSKIIVAIH